MLTLVIASLVLWLGPVAGCPNVAKMSAPQAATASDFEALYNRGKTYMEFRDAARRRRQAWRGHYANAQVPEGLRARVVSVPGRWRLLVVAEDWCGDSANTVPYIAKLVDVAPNLDMRIVDSKAGRHITESHRTPDGRAATPTLLLLDTNFEEMGCWVERPAKLQAWVLENQPKLDEDELFDQKYAWYDADKGQETLREIVAMIESAGMGEPTCSSYGG